MLSRSGVYIREQVSFATQVGLIVVDTYVPPVDIDDAVYQR